MLGLRHPFQLLIYSKRTPLIIASPCLLSEKEVSTSIRKYIAYKEHNHVFQKLDKLDFGIYALEP